MVQLVCLWDDFGALDRWRAIYSAKRKRPFLLTWRVDRLIARVQPRALGGGASERIRRIGRRRWHGVHGHTSSLCLSRLWL